MTPYTSLCKSCKYRCKSRYFVDDCSMYKLKKEYVQGVQLTVFDMLSEKLSK